MVGAKKIGYVACVCLYKEFIIVGYSPSPGAMCIVSYLEHMSSNEVSVRGSTIESRGVFLEVAWPQSTSSPRDCRDIRQEL